MRSLIFALLVALFCVVLPTVTGGWQSAQAQEELTFDLDFDDEPAGPPPALIAVLVVVGVIAALVGIAIAVAVLLLLASFLRAIPPEHRRMEPAMVWLLLIPCFNIIWNFYVYPRISASYQSYFESVGRTDVGDCAGSIGLWYAFATVCALIPAVNLIAGPASVVLWIIYLIQVNGLKKQVLSKPGMAAV